MEGRTLGGESKRGNVWAGKSPPEKGKKTNRTQKGVDFANGSTAAENPKNPKRTDVLSATKETQTTTKVKR